MHKITFNSYVLNWIDDVVKMTKPANVLWIDGSEEQMNKIREEGCSTGELRALNTEKYPGCVYHRSKNDDVARMEDKTFICSLNKEHAGPTNNWKSPEEAYKLGKEIFNNSMSGRTMYIIPYSMGPIGSPFSKIGFEITDSIYVVLSMHIMTRTGQKVLDALGDSNDFVRGVHGKCNLDIEKRYIFHFPEDNTIWSCNSAYGGNVLLGKKCFALRIASYQAWKEGWMAEHMLILGIENPKGEVKYVAAAFPSACGKTNLAMLIPPELYKKKGYKVWTVGDDIAWLRIKEDGRLWAINPEAGFFGVAPGTNEKSNYNALMSTMKNTIFTNVAYNLDDDTVWWEKMNDNPPENGLDWQGNPWNGKLSKEKGAHPNSRFTAPAKNCPCISSQWESPEGVPLSAIIFGGRRAKTAPLVYQSRNWQHGVFVGSTLASETTAAAAGKVGLVRRDPMAMLPFCGYNMGDYFAHWLEMGTKMSNPPKIFHVNWFRTNKEGKFLWPGFGDNFRVLEWIIKRCENKVDFVESPIGNIPKVEDINIEGLNISKATIDNLLKIDKNSWLEDEKNIEEFYAKIGDTMPEELKEELAILKSNLKNALVAIVA
ncbi:MAG: phosphoenolpyruvate carboxykinase (GTP) [Sedimentibacter sp.]|uniref:phosphoenolpyruvate carboxykinase (GTP) n=1 Tax=Sedimentibacter sp. TaxID=1960295 RepID=UPI00298137F9|nr:phosphoenolpyruvate carboxykinase (GTP) [Sedimentibacter sp.]MDW5299493.1 phosphoenolpyruvate carboxykinase (GTP) [Sedimentibacter sp.]